jgi:hypothetical protein
MPSDFHTAWLKRQQEKGGFIDFVCRGLEPAGYLERIRQGPPSEVIDRFIINDEDSAFVFDCVGVCNLEALQLEFCGDEVALRALYLRRLLHGIDIPEESDLQRFRSILKDVVDSVCGPLSPSQAYVFNATVVPSAPLGYLTLWPDGSQQPVVSTLNAIDGAVTSNMAIVPTSNGKIDAFASNLTQLILDINSYFAP